MREHIEQPGRGPGAAQEQQQPRRAGASAAGLPAGLGNRAMAALAATSPQLPRGRGLGAGGAARVAARLLTSPPNSDTPAQDALEEGAELTTPTAGSTTTPTQPVVDATTRQQPAGLQIKSSGAIEGSYGISQYWPVTNYWGADKTLGEFTQPLAGQAGWHMLGHKFQTIGRFTSVCTEHGTGRVTFLQEARLTNTKGGTPGPWFNDMHYTDASHANHYWDPNSEVGTNTGNGPGVRRTIAADAYAYTDPPAISYGPDTDTYRKLEFKIHLKPPSGSPDSEIVQTATQEIEVKDGTPKVLQSP
jgi:hypothetical protein